MTDEQKPDSGLVEEIQALSQQLSAAVRALWDSEESRKLRQDIGDGFVELGRQLDSAIKSAQESEAAKQFSEQVRETVEKARETDIAGKLEEGLVSGLRDLNEGLSKLVKSMEEQRPAKEKPGAETEAEAANETAA